jgi:hypothetical protein
VLPERLVTLDVSVLGPVGKVLSVLYTKLITEVVPPFGLTDPFKVAVVSPMGDAALIRTSGAAIGVKDLIAP